MNETTYPTDPELEEIRNWDYKQGFHELLEQIRHLWQYADCGYWEEYDGVDEFQGRFRCYQLSTAGWSGNEDLLDAMKKNIMFWLTCWYRSQRGGHYEFRVPIKEQQDGQSD